MLIKLLMRVTIREKDEFQNKTRQRVPSRSPNRDPRPRSRGRSKEKDSAKANERSSSFAAEVEVLQYYSVLSKSPSRIDSTPKSVPSVYRRQITPNTMKHFRDTLFFPTTAEKFKSVWLEKRCLRCFSQKHRAIMCPVYTSPCPNVCKYCHYLYHDTKACIFFDNSGKSRPNSLNRTAWQDPSSEKTLLQSSEIDLEIDYFAEAWEDQHDFHYLNDYATVIQNVSAFRVNPAVKAKFKYPSSDPTPNEIEEDRTDAKK